MADKLKVKVTVVPTQGKSTTATVELKKSGASLKEVLKAAKVSAENKDLMVNGEPATLDTHVTASDKVSIQVRVSERPQGS